MAGRKPSPRPDETAPAHAARALPHHGGQEAALQHRAAFVIGEFLAAWLAQLHRTFHGDLIAALILGEIAHGNLRAIRGARVNGSGAAGFVERLYDGNGEFDAALLRPCNALSISASTGVPRETVRRKVKILIEEGLVRRTARNKLLLDAAAVGAFLELERRMIDELIVAAARLERVRGKGSGSQHSEAAAGADRHTILR